MCRLPEDETGPGSSHAAPRRVLHVLHRTLASETAAMSDSSARTTPAAVSARGAAVKADKITGFRSEFQAFVVVWGFAPAAGPNIFVRMVIGASDTFVAATNRGSETSDYEELGATSGGHRAGRF